MPVRNTTGQVALAQSGDGSRHEIGGRYNWIYCYDTDEPVTVEFYRDNRLLENPRSERFTLLDNRDFDRAVIVNDSGQSNTIEFWFGVGSYSPSNDRASVVVQNASLEANVKVSNSPENPVNARIVDGNIVLNAGDINVNAGVSGSAVSVPDVLCMAGQTTQVIAGNANNLRVRVTNPDDSEIDLRIGCHGQVAANNGTPLYPGATWETLTTASVYVYAPAGSDVSLPVEIERAF